MMRKKFFTVILSLLLGTFLFAQVSVDPSDNFYSLVESWEMRGVITNVPPLRPYPVNCIIDILETVIKNGTAGDKTVAQFFLDDIKAKNWYVNLDSEFICKTIENEKNNPTVSFMTSFYPSVTGDAVTINDKLSIGYKLGLAIRNTQNEINFLPLFSNSEHDAIQYPLTLDMLNAYVDVNGVFSFGTKNLYMQSGIYRNGYGPFLNEGLCLNDQSYHSGNISFTALTDKLSFSQLISVIGATTNVNLDSSNIYYGKFLSFHQVGYSFTKKFSVTYYESIVFGNRLDPMYLMPVPFAVCESITGNKDNLQMGLTFKYLPLNGLMWATDLFVDSLSLGELFDFNFDSKNCFAFKTGVIYTPENSVCTRVSLNYILVSPYTYTHSEFDDVNETKISKSTVNYQNYTNNGIKMGARYEPNSDGIDLSIDFIPSAHFHLNVSSSFTRFGNICENLSTRDAVNYLLAEEGVYSTGGTVFTHSMYANESGNKVSSAWNSFNMFKQRNVMYVIQEGINCEYEFPSFYKNKIHISLTFGWFFEYIHNYGAANDMFPGGLITKGTNDTGELIYIYNNSDIYWHYTKEDEMVAFFKDVWADKLEDRLNNYFTLGIKIKF